MRLSWDNSWHMDRPHFHEDIEILLCLSEGGDFFIENELYPLHWGALFLIGEATLHKSTASESYKRYVLHISAAELKELSMPQTDFLACIREAGHCVQLDRERANELIALFEQLEQPRVNRFGSDMQKVLVLMNLLLKVFSSFDTTTANKVDLNPDTARISHVLDYIAEHLAEPLTLDTIATHCFMNKFHLCHSFKAVTGFSVMEYIIYSRVLRARQLLQDGVSVQQAGEMSGFSDNSHFIRTFGHLTGVTPGRYAKEHLSSDQILMRTNHFE